MILGLSDITSTCLFCWKLVKIGGAPMLRAAAGLSMASRSKIGHRHREKQNWLRRGDVLNGKTWAWVCWRCFLFSAWLLRLIQFGNLQGFFVIFLCLKQIQVRAVRILWNENCVRHSCWLMIFVMGKFTYLWAGNPALFTMKRCFDMAYTADLHRWHLLNALHLASALHSALDEQMDGRNLCYII